MGDMTSPPADNSGDHAKDTQAPKNDPPPIDLDNPPFPLTAIDRALLATPDEDFNRITWSDLRHFIRSNQLEELKRLPSDLKRYLAWSHDIKTRYGSITNFVIQERLKWTPCSRAEGETGPPKFEFKNAVPFADERDFAILRNDWPYGLAPGIIHLLVWSKTPIPVDAERGDVTAESRRVIVEFVQRYFVDEVGEEGGGWERVLWFKNWVSLQSVRGVDHVHVLVRDVDEGVVEGWTRRRDL